jgi:hypothetical protein
MGQTWYSQSTNRHHISWIVLMDSSVCTATEYLLDDRMIRVRFPAGAGNFSLRQTGYGVHVASYPMGTRDYSAEVKEWLELYLHSPNTSSWRGT